MAVAITPAGRRTVFGDRRVGFYDLVFSGTYTTGGEAVTAASFGLNSIDLILTEATISTATTTAEIIAYTASTGKIQMFESGAANAPLAEKGSAEAYVAGTNARVMVIGN